MVSLRNIAGENVYQKLGEMSLRELNSFNQGLDEEDIRPYGHSVKQIPNMVLTESLLHYIDKTNNYEIVLNPDGSINIEGNESGEIRSTRQGLERAFKTQFEVCEEVSV